jgi:signal peptidase
MANSRIQLKKLPASWILSAVQVVLIAALVTIAVASFGTRIPFLANLGFNFFGVVSGSMEPTIPVGSLVYAGKYRMEDLKKGDIITYRKPNPSTNEFSVVTHRIDDAKKTEEKQQLDVDGQKSEKTIITYTFKTKGDANDKADEYDVAPNEIIGLYKWHIPMIGRLSIFAQTPQGFILLVILPAVLLIVWEVIELLWYFKGKQSSAEKEEIARLKEELAKKS